MPDNTLDTLHQRIAQHERELKALKEERDRVGALIRRKEELQNQLQQVETEIAALSSGASATPEQRKAAAPPAPPPKAPAPKSQPKLGELILVLLRESGKPMTARQLSEAALRRGFQPTAQDPIRSAEVRLQELKKKGAVRRAAGQPGYILAAATSPAKAAKPKTPAPTPSPASNAAAKADKAKTAAKPAQPQQPAKQPSLRQALVNVLKNSRKPLSGAELAERVKASGYKTTSAKFVEIVWSTLGQMDEVQRVAGKGYQLKRKG